MPPLVSDVSLLKRVAVAIVFIPLLLWIFHARGLPLFFFLAAITIVGQAELYSMVQDGVGRAQRAGGYAAGLFILADAAFTDSRFFFFLLTTVMIYAFIIEILGRAATHFQHVTLSIFTALYPAVFLSYLLKIELLPSLLFGARKGFLLIFILVVVWVFDTASYFAGRSFGRHPFFPAISPKKTVEGFIGGLAGALATGLAFGVAEGGVVTGSYVMLAFIIGLAGQAGDLSESIIKRGMNTKDSSHIIPGHGGILDRFDSLFFAGPAVYFFLVMLGGLVEL